MKTRKFLLALVLGALFTSSLMGCSSSPSSSSSEIDPKDQPIQPVDRLLEMPSWATPQEELESHDNDVSFHQNSETDVEADYSFNIKLDDEYFTGALSEYIRVYDSTRIQYSLDFSKVSNTVYHVTPNKPYELGRYFTIEIKDNAPFHLDGKDPEMKEFHFRTKSLGGDREVYNVKESIHRFLLDDVISKQELNSSSKDVMRVMTVKNPLHLKEGDVFLFWDGVKIDRHAFYGKFHHEEAKNSIYMVYYNSPELGEIFDENGLDVSYHNYVPTEIYDLVLASENEIKENLANDPALNDFFYQSYLLYEPEKPHMKNDAFDWIMAMKSIQIVPEFGFYWPGWSFSIALRVTIPFDYATLTFLFQYYRQSTVSASAEISLKKCMDIPYWAELAVDISEVVDTTYRLTIAVGDTLPAPEDDDDLFKSLSDYTKDAASDYKDADSKMETIKQSGKDGVKFDGKTLTIRLGRGRFPIGWVFDVFLDLNLTIKLEASAMLSFSYTEHSENNIMSYRSGNEDKSSHSVSGLKTSTKTIMLIGTIGLDVGIFLKFGIGVCGLEDYVNFNIHANIGVYVTLGGYGMWSWTFNASGKQFEGHGGFIFEVGWFASVGVELYLFFVDLSVDFITIRQPFYSTTTGQYFISPPEIEGNKISLETHEIAVADLGLLTFNTFNVAYMKPVIDTFDPEAELDYTDDHGDSQYGKVFNFSFKGGKYIRYENGFFIIKDDCPCKFTDTLYVEVPRSLYKLGEGETRFIEVTIDFYDVNARPVYFDGELLGYYRFGDLIDIPGSPADKEGYRFYAWKCLENNSLYAQGEKFVVPMNKDSEPHKRLDFTSDYYQIIYHDVTFYDGLGNVISNQTVEEATDALEPTEADRDKNMPANAIFLGWSTDFTNVFYDTEVYAIYLYVDAEV